MTYQLEIGRGVRIEIAEHWAFWEALQSGQGDRLLAEIYEMTIIPGECGLLEVDFRRR